MNNSRKKISFGKILAMSGVIMVAAIIIGVNATGADNIFANMRKFQTVFEMVRQMYFEEPDSEKMTENAIRGMLKELDPHSAYITAEDMKEVNEDMSGSFEGIGVSFSIIDDSLVVESPITDGPSEKVGIMARDRIVTVDGESLVGVSQDSIRKLLRGPKGTKVVLGVYRPATRKTLEFTVVRDKIPLYTVDASFLIDSTDIGYIKINRFGQNTTKELQEAGQKLFKAGMKRLILDLRNNSGGLLDQAYSVSDEFLSSDTIVYTVGRDTTKKTQVFVAGPGQSMENIPLIVLINEGSASASEITAAAIQELDRGLVVGQTSFGKGLVQRQVPLSDGSAVRITIARFYGPSGRCLQRPFKDRKDWLRMIDRLELEEGANLEHTLDKIRKDKMNDSVVTKAKKRKFNPKDKSIDMDSIDIFYTRKGRPLLGGGGVTPDYTVRAFEKGKDTITQLGRELWYSGIFGEVVDALVAEYKAKYGSDYLKFKKEFKLTDKIIKLIKDKAEEYEIDWNDKQFADDKDWIENQIKFMLARSVWDMNTASKVKVDSDRQLSKAMTLFPMAEQIRKGKK